MYDQCTDHNRSPDFTGLTGFVVWKSKTVVLILNPKRNRTNTVQKEVTMYFVVEGCFSIECYQGPVCMVSNKHNGRSSMVSMFLKQIFS